MTDNDEVVLYEARGAVATITLNRANAYNAFNAAMRTAMLGAVERAEADNNVRIVIVRGAGRGFCSGADLTEPGHDPVSERIEGEYKPFLALIAEGTKIYIAQVHKSAAGIGAALALTCDLMVMAEDANLYMAFAAVALVPDGGNTWFLAQAMGHRRALEAILEGRKIPAAECVALGLANKVVRSGDLEAETRAWAGRLAQGAPLAMVAAKTLLRQTGHMTLGDAISAEAVAQNPLSRSADREEGARAFLAGDKPVFRGR